ICVSGKATVKGFRYSQEAQQRSTAFENGIGSFTYVDGAYTANGGLTLLGANGKSALYAPIEMCDFTVKTQLSSAVSSGYAGIGIGFAEDYIFLGRHAGRIIAAHVTNGDYAVYGSIGDVSGSVTLQLEKVANAYRAVAIDGNGNVTVVAEDILANYSKVEAMLVASDCDASFGYLSFGDDINGREGFASFIAQGKIDFSLTSSSSLYQYNVFGGNWQYVIGGIEQTDKTAENAHYAYTAGALSSFRATFALRAEFAGEGSFVQAMWGKPSAGSDQGYAMKITPDGKAVLIDSRSNVLDEYVIEGFEQGADYDFTVSVRGSNAFVYFGTDEKLILSSPVAGGKGYFGWKGSFASFAITSYGVYSADGNYTVLSGAINVFRNEHVQGGTDIEISGAGSNYGYVSLKKTTVANFATSFNLQLTRTSLISRGRFRVYIGGKSGYNSLRSGLIFQLDDRGRITIYEDGEKKVDNYEAKKFDTQSCYIVLAYVDGVLNVYQADYKEDLNYSRKDIEKIYTYNDSFCRSGALSFYTNNASVRMCNIRAMAVDRDEDYTKGVLFTDYFIDSPPAPEPEIVSAPAKVGYENDFSDKMTLGDFTRYSGAISISDGMLIVDGIYGNNWDAGTGLAYGTFENFELKVKVNVQNAFGFGAIEFNKASPSVNHQQSAITLMITNSGASLYLGNDVYQPGSSVGVVHGENGFMDVTLRVENGVITYDLGAESASFKISELKRNNLYSGFISFNAGSNKVYFDDLKITLL
ncbi:MAG: hypothetical protein IKC36_01910, partial [Clostridia bacterium]|nr:hypothetical protein [Clostridia bacterium]